MPELPEIETLRHDLEREVAGKRIKTVELSSAKIVSRHANRKQFITKVEGAKVNSAKRRGDLVLLALDNDHTIVVDLTTSGYLRRTPTKNATEPHTLGVFTFTQHGQLRLIDPADGQAQMFVGTAEEVAEQFPGLNNLGRDPLNEPMSWLTFGELLRANRLRLKAFLTDSSVLAGIGPMYSDEILFEAGLRPDRWSNELSSQEVRRLYRAVVETMHEAVKHRGVTLGPDGFHDLAGRAGGFGEYLNVYDREGEACPRCRAVVVKRRIGGKATFMCEQCQV
jgi:formamidopyrimidine-DNA glycosylase